MSEIATYHIHLTGLVQGVGMRPFVAQLAKKFRLNGWVNNSADGVHIEINSTEEAASDFLQHILISHPSNAIIHRYKLNKSDSKQFHSFEIRESAKQQKPDLLLTPDLSMCENCRTELYSGTSNRLHYPFITCSHCGPRYSIARTLPYDRANTSMKDFKMCEFCEGEYKSITDRRFHSQTNSCPQCGITMNLYENGVAKTGLQQADLLRLVLDGLSNGKILAVKGIGGFVLLCDSTKTDCIKLLRQRKQRPTKPFALLFNDIEQIERFAEINEEESNCLNSVATPIVLLTARTNTSLALADIAPGLSQIGCMLPGSPLLDLLVNLFGAPLVCTSANISDSPILFRDNSALSELNSIADLILTHNREITNPQDDSVVRIARESKQQIIIRRARGLAPNFLDYEQKNKAATLTTGALMKSSFTLQGNNKTYVSQYLGNTSSLDAQETYLYSLKTVSELLQFQPEQIIADKHPDYFSSELAMDISSNKDIPVFQVQHHKAHFAAVLAEHSLLEINEPVMGVIWDGLGLGDDGQVWGSEFFKYENKEMLRSYHFDYYPLLLNDKMAKEPRLSALAICDDLLESGSILEKKFSPDEWSYYKKFLQREQPLYCCSMGRIFDAVACLLNLSDKQTYEGEAALRLQNLAEEYTNGNGYNLTESYFMDGAHYYRISTSSLFRSILRDIRLNKNNSFIAAKFHYSLVHLIEIVAGNIAVKKIAFSGGVFQNSLLVDMIHHLLGRKLDLYFHHQLAPNDENISFGQMAYFDHCIDSIKENRIEVPSKVQTVDTDSNLISHTD